MQNDTIYKTIHQYSSLPILPEDMKKLQAVAVDYSKVKNYVYQRYGGIGGLSKIYPGYTVQNEMTASGLRAQLGLPSVYFYLAIFEALGDIKSQWTKIKNSILERIKSNERFTPEDRHYLRVVLKISGCFENILTGCEVDVPKEMSDVYGKVAADVNTETLNRYLCRQVRRNLRTLRTEKTDGFAVSEKAYRYGKNGETYGIYLSTKEKRKRIFVALTDENQYKRQLYIKLKPKTNRLEISVPMEVKIQHHDDYQKELGLAIGMKKMFVTDKGHIYGEEFEKIHTEIVDFMRMGDYTYRREKKNNPGRQKYKNRKAKLDAKMKTYINQEINRMLNIEKPGIIYIPKLPGPKRAGANKKINYSVSIWKRGFIRQRLEQKCRGNAIEIVEVIGKDISRQCSECGQLGEYTGDIFYCGSCGCKIDKKINAARNVKRRGMEGETVN